jgi:hypothetical protein
MSINVLGRIENKKTFPLAIIVCQRLFILVVRHANDQIMVPYNGIMISAVGCILIIIKKMTWIVDIAKSDIIPNL